MLDRDEMLPRVIRSTQNITWFVGDAVGLGVVRSGLYPYTNVTSEIYDSLIIASPLWRKAKY